MPFEHAAKKIYARIMQPVFYGSLPLQADGGHVSEKLSDQKTNLIVRIDTHPVKSFR